MQKMIGYVVTVILFSGLFSGCVTVADVQNRLSTFHGLTENDLVERWGIPSGVYEKDGVRHVQYSQQNNIFIPGSSPTSYNTIVINDYHYTTATGGSPAMNINCSCKFIFEVVNDIIVRTSFDGTRCGRGKEFPLGRPLVDTPSQHEVKKDYWESRSSRLTHNPKGECIQKR